MFENCFWVHKLGASRFVVLVTNMNNHLSRDSAPWLRRKLPQFCLGLIFFVPLSAGTAPPPGGCSVNSLTTCISVMPTAVPKCPPFGNNNNVMMQATNIASQSIDARFQITVDHSNQPDLPYQQTHDTWHLHMMPGQPIDLGCQFTEPPTPANASDRYSYVPDKACLVGATYCP